MSWHQGPLQKFESHFAEWNQGQVWKGFPKVRLTPFHLSLYIWRSWMHPTMSLTPKAETSYDCAAGAWKEDFMNVTLWGGVQAQAWHWYGPRLPFPIRGGAERWFRGKGSYCQSLSPTLNIQTPQVGRRELTYANCSTTIPHKVNKHCKKLNKDWCFSR